MLKDISAGREGDEGVKSDLTLAEWLTRLKGTDRGYPKAILWILALLITLYVFGFLITIPLFTISYLKSHGETWRFSVGLSVMVWGIFFVTFVFGLNVSLYKGILFSLLFS